MFKATAIISWVSNRIVTALFLMFIIQNNAVSQNPSSHSADTFKPIEQGLILDLDADFGIQTEDSNRVIRWENKVDGASAQYFKSRDKGREIAGSGRPKLKEGEDKIGRQNTVVFHRQELINHKEDAFDHLTTGKGYTWFAVLAAHKQRKGLKDVNSFFGNLRNGGNYEGFWGGLTDDNRVWMGSRNGITFGRWDRNNPKVLASKALQKRKFYLIMGHMEAGSGTATVKLFVNNLNQVAAREVPVNPEANPSKFAIGQERDATNHPGRESFDGEIARFLLYERPLSNSEMDMMQQNIKKEYKIK